MNLSHTNTSAESGPIQVPAETQPEACILDEQSFHYAIARERKRTERSKTPFMLVLLDAGNCVSSDKSEQVLSKVLAALASSCRATDVLGWYESDRVAGLMFTEIAMAERETILTTMMNRINATLQTVLTVEKFSEIGVSLHVFPEDWNQKNAHGNPALYPDWANRDETQKVHRVAKRCVDIVASAAFLLVFMPLFLLVAAIVKLSSKGPVLFKQPRLGQFGKTFTFLKFRSMYVNNDTQLHQEFMKRVIAGQHGGDAGDGGRVVYKMTNDPRITPIGRILRRTSLDELPQFLSVLKGDMSLVGPRPPIAYECEEYDLWHRRRVLEVKPGITGLWQVTGRSRVRFDDMVRLDLRYIRSWSLWLDLKILAKTPKAILFHDDAY